MNPCDISGGLENFEVVYFPGAELFRNFREGYSLGDCISYGGDRYFLAHKLWDKQLICNFFYIS